MARKRRPPTPPRVDENALAAFRQGLRRRYTDEQILAELKASARRLGRSPTMREFEADPAASVHPQTIVERFGSWNEAKRRAGLVPRALHDPRGSAAASCESSVRSSGASQERRTWTRGASACRRNRSTGTRSARSPRRYEQAGFDVPVGEERLERAIVQGSALALELGRLPRFVDWKAARNRDAAMLTEWQVYRMLGGGAGAWPTLPVSPPRPARPAGRLGRDRRHGAARPLKRGRIPRSASSGRRSMPMLDSWGTVLYPSFRTTEDEPAGSPARARP